MILLLSFVRHSRTADVKVSATPVLVSAHVHHALHSSSDENPVRESRAKPAKVSVSRMTITNSRSIVYTAGSDSDAIRAVSSDELAESESKAKRPTKKRSQPRGRGWSCVVFWAGRN